MTFFCSVPEHSAVRHSLHHIPPCWIFSHDALGVGGLLTSCCLGLQCNANLNIYPFSPLFSIFHCKKTSLYEAKRLGTQCFLLILLSFVEQVLNINKFVVCLHIYSEVRKASLVCNTINTILQNQGCRNEVCTFYSVAIITIIAIDYFL